MIKEVEVAINGLRKLDLSKYPIADFNHLFKKLGTVGCIEIDYHFGKAFWRSRPNYNEEIFSSKAELSCKPAFLNKTLQRASLPYTTMFYASLIPEKIEASDNLPDPMVINALEVLPWLRGTNTKGIQKLTYSKWIVTKQIKLLGILQHKDFINQSAYTKEIYESFVEFMGANPDRRDETFLISDFFAGEFAKENIIHDYDYFLSACYSDFAVRMGYDGVAYPSVRTVGKGLNVAIRPGIIEDHLQLTAVLQSTVYKNDDKVFIDHDSRAYLNSGETNFNLVPLPISERAGIDESLRQVGVKSVSELL